MSERTRTSQIVISDREPGLPFSKGLLASQVMVTGLSPYRAYQVAEEVEIRLLERRRASVTSAELAEVAIEVIGEVAGERYATNFVRWREIETLDVPLVILIGGATGVGKSTIATQLAARLGIVRIVATDAIREVMRAMLSEELMPTLHVSSFQADEALREPPTKTADALTLGFREQTAAVSVGINALIERAAARGDEHRHRGGARRPRILRRRMRTPSASSRYRSSSGSTTKIATGRISPPAKTRSPRARRPGTSKGSKGSGGCSGT